MIAVWIFSHRELSGRSNVVTPFPLNIKYSWFVFLVMRINRISKEEYNIFNIKTGGHLALVMDFEKVNKIIVAILKGKYEEPVTKTDEDFMNSNLHFIRSECIQHILNETMFWKIDFFNHYFIVIIK